MPNRISSTVSCFALIVLMLVASAARAQVSPTANNVEPGAERSNPTVTARATADRVRFTSPNTVVQLRLEVYDEAGQKVLDTEQRGGNVIDWHLQGGAGERVADGVYLCVLTSKNLSGRFSQKLGRVTVSGQSNAVQPAAIAELNPRQAQTVGPVETGAAELTVMDAEDAPAVTVLANNGNDAQLARTRGALTFRVGDFFSGNDKEQMRLSEEGNLGIGTTKPKAKLDVAGLIRAREGFMFSDGSTLKVNEKGVLTRTNADGTAPSTVTTTQDKIAKFTDNAGTVGDSVITESAGNIGIGTTTPSHKLEVVDPSNMGLRVQTNTAGGTVASFGGLGDFQIDAPGFAGGRFIVKEGGNVGIGTPAPAYRLEVLGNAHFWDTLTIDKSADIAANDGQIKLTDPANSSRGLILGHQQRNGSTFSFIQTAPDGVGLYPSLAIQSNGGNVGIGTTAPLFKFHVKTGADQNLVVRPSADFSGGLTGIGLQSINNGNTLYQPLDLEGSQVTLNVGSGGNVGIRTNAPTQALEVANGRMITTGSQTLAAPGGILEIGTTLTNNHNQASGIRMRNTFNGNADSQSALDVAPTFAPSASISLARGFISTAFFAPPAGVTITDGYGGNANTVYSNTAGAVTNGTGFNIRTPIVLGSLKPTTQYGLHILNQGIAGTTNTYGLFVDAQSGSANNYSAIFSGGNVGIGTSSPNARLQVAGGNIYVPNPNSLIITSPNGTCWFITVANSGALSTIPVPCP